MPVTEHFGIKCSSNFFIKLHHCDNLQVCVFLNSSNWWLMMDPFLLFHGEQYIILPLEIGIATLLETAILFAMWAECTHFIHKQLNINTVCNLLLVTSNGLSKLQYLVSQSRVMWSLARFPLESYFTYFFSKNIFCAVNYTVFI